MQLKILRKRNFLKLKSPCGLWDTNFILYDVFKNHQFSVKYSREIHFAVVVVTGCCQSAAIFKISQITQFSNKGCVSQMFVSVSIWYFRQIWSGHFAFLPSVYLRGAGFRSY